MDQLPVGTVLINKSNKTRICIQGKNRDCYILRTEEQNLLFYLPLSYQFEDYEIEFPPNLKIEKKKKETRLDRVLEELEND